MATMADDLSAHVHVPGLSVGVYAGMVLQDAGRSLGRDRVGKRRVQGRMAHQASFDGVADAEDEKAKSDRSPDAEAPDTR